jgi:hypothetical protein
MSLFHYADINSVASILQNKKLWLTDLSFLNDKNELHGGIEELLHALETPIPGLWANHEYIKESVEYLRDGLRDSVGYGLEEKPIFTCSFSRAEDLLSQWRAYGSYAIELDEKRLLNDVPNLKQCIYDTRTKKKTAAGHVTSALIAVSNDMGANDGCIGTKCIDALSDIVTVAATFKHEGFTEEQEVRLIMQSDDEKHPVKYRPKGNLLIPYIEVGISLDCIKAVHIGPMNEQDLAFKSLSSFAKQIEREWQIETSNIEYWLQVKNSPTPYRTI